MHKVKIAFQKFWTKSMTSGRFFRKMPFIQNHFQFVDTKQNPDIVFCASSIAPGAYTRVFYNNENLRPDTKNNEWSFGTDYEEDIKHPRYMRHPNYARNGAGTDLIKTPNFADVAKQKTKFCAFVYAHTVPVRDQFFRVLSRYKRVDSPGNCCHNIAPIGGYKTAHDSRYRSPSFFDDKIKFLRDYKFAIIFENSSYPGYVSEKIYHAMLAGCIPIYWGNPNIGRDFNTKSFISAYDSKQSSIRDMLRNLTDRVEAIDTDEKAYLRMLRRPWYHGNKLSKYVRPKAFIDQLQRIVRS